MNTICIKQQKKWPFGWIYKCCICGQHSYPLTKVGEFEEWKKNHKHRKLRMCLRK